MSNAEEHQAFVEQALSAYRADESPDESLVLADYFTERGDMRSAASALDRAYGLNPDDQTVAERRQAILDELEVIEHGIRFRYVPAGTFLMGSEVGDHDEKPVHPVRTDEYWVSETTVTWSTYCEVCNLKSPTEMTYEDFDPGHAERFSHSMAWGWKENQLLQDEPEKFELNVIEPHKPFRCTVDAEKYPKRGLDCDTKPMVGLDQEQLNRFFNHLSTPGVTYQLPTEKHWEKAARGGRIGHKYPWGNSPPNSANCDWSNLAGNDIKHSKTFAPNGYGLYAMSGSVWEWTSERYDKKSYSNVGASKRQKRKGEPLFRGGSWADCAEALTVSFRMSASSAQTRSPTFGFRIFRSDLPLE